MGRGAIPLHFAGFNASREESRERFEESLEIIKKAWTTDSFSHRGTFYDIPETSVVPKPVPKPHPPLRVAADSGWHGPARKGSDGDDVLCSGRCSPNAWYAPLLRGVAGHRGRGATSRFS